MSRHCARLPLKGAFIRPLNKMTTTGALIYCSFFMFRVWKCMNSLSHNVVGHSTGSIFYSVGLQQSNGDRGMHSDRHCLCHSLRFYQFIPSLSSYGQPFKFALCAELPLTDTFTGFGMGTYGTSNRACRKTPLNNILIHQ